MTKQQAIDFYGSQQALAKALRLTQPSIAEWGDYPPALRQIQLEQLTKRKLRAEPDVFGPKPKRGKPEQRAA